MQSAKISTINSFCFELLRDNITDQGITSGFGVLDDSDNKVLRAQAMDELFDYYTGNEYEKISYLYDRFCVKGSGALMGVIAKADEFLASVALRDQWLDSAVNEYGKPFRESVYFRALMESLVRRTERGVRIADECLSMIPLIFPDMSDSKAAESYSLAEADYDRLCRLRDIFRSGRFPDEDEAAELTAFGGLPRVTAKTVHDKGLRDIYKAKREILKKIPAAVIDSISTVESDYKESGEVTKVLTEVIRKYQEIVWRRKCEKNAISFDDGERLALELLADTDSEGRLIQTETALRTAENYI